MKKNILDKISDGDYDQDLALYGPGEAFKRDCLIELGRLTLSTEGEIIFKHSKADLLVEMTDLYSSYEETSSRQSYYFTMLDLNKLIG